MSVIIGFVVWCFLIVVAAMRFSVQPRFSASERERLARQGDAAALDETEAIAEQPLLTSLHQLLLVIVAVGYVAYCLAVFGVVMGLVVAVITLAFAPILFRVSFVCTVADTLRGVTAPWLRKVAHTFAPFLRLVRPRDSIETDAALNSRDELLDLVRRSPGIMSHDEQTRLVANLRFDEKTVKDIMTPRSMIEAVPVGETLGPLILDELYKTGHSRFPVYDGDLDHVVGMLYLRDLVDIRQGSQPAKKAMQSKVCFIREDRDLSHALHGFLRTHHHLFVVVNSYRETVGLLSLEDVIETLIGAKINDEFDAFDNLRAVAEHNPHDNNEPKGKEDI